MSVSPSPKHKVKGQWQCLVLGRDRGTMLLAARPRVPLFCAGLWKGLGLPPRKVLTGSIPLSAKYHGQNKRLFMHRDYHNKISLRESCSNCKVVQRFWVEARGPAGSWGLCSPWAEIQEGRGVPVLWASNGGRGRSKGSKSIHRMVQLAHELPPFPHIL